MTSRFRELCIDFKTENTVRKNPTIIMVPSEISREERLRDRIASKNREISILLEELCKAPGDCGQKMAGKALPSFAFQVIPRSRRDPVCVYGNWPVDGARRSNSYVGGKT